MYIKLYIYYMYDTYMYTSINQLFGLIVLILVKLSKLLLIEARLHKICHVAYLCWDLLFPSHKPVVVEIAF